MKSKSNNRNRLQPVVRSIRMKTFNGSVELELFNPQDLTNFEIVLEVFVGIEGGSQGLERFDVTVCTPKWIFENINENDHIIGHGMLIVPKYSYARIVEYIESYIKMCTANNIADVMRRVGLLGEWESEWESMESI